MYDIAWYGEAGSVAEAIALLQARPRACPVAGGSDVLIRIKKGKIRDAELVGIYGIPGLQGVGLESDGTIVIGSGTTFSQVIADPLLRARVPLLTEAAATVGGPQIRNLATIGGNICNGAPSADSAPALLALDARLRIEGPLGSRVTALRDFYRGPGRVDLKRDEILTAILLAPDDYRGMGGCYIKFAGRAAMDIAILGCAAVCRLNGNVVEDFRLALGVAGPTPLRCPRTEALVRGSVFSESLLAAMAETAVSEAGPRSSWRASKEFRLHLVAELSKRAFREAFIKAGGEISC